jgi:hypothetical protein
MHKAREMPKEQFKREVERELTGRETEPWEIILSCATMQNVPGKRSLKRFATI